MGEGFELYHIPQQSRRDKLRVVLHNNAATDYGIIDNVGNNNNNNNEESLDLQSVGECNFLYTHQELGFIQHHHDQPLALSLSSHNTHTAGYASVLKGSKFLNPAQQLLDEICDVGFGIYADKFDVVCDPPPLDNLTRTSVDDSDCNNRKRSRLISLQDEVYKRYKQYYQQMQAVIASFETVAGLSSASPFASMDLKAMSKHFCCLNNAIIDQLQFSVKPHVSYAKEDLAWSGTSHNELYGQRAVNDIEFIDHQPVWRPQRGLPKRAVTVLRAWLFDHFLHPYPTDTDKQMLAKQTGLSRNQVSNWFINARVRLWKPMVEEVHTLETKQGRKITSYVQEQETSHQRNQDAPSKRARNDYKYNNDHHIMDGNKEHMNFHDNFSIHSANRGVSLTLGLHQNNNAITFSDHFPLSAERFAISGLDARNQQIGGEITGGQFLHDFGG